MSVDRNVIRPTAVNGGRIPAEILQKMLDLSPPGMPIVRSCITCDKFAEMAVPASSAGPATPAEHCRAFNARPPARVIAYGCPQYENDDVPF